MWADTLLILCISVCTAFMGEGLTWLLVYRTEKYQKLKLTIEKQTKRLEKKKEAHGDSTLGKLYILDSFMTPGWKLCERV